MRSDPSRLPIRFDAEKVAAFCSKLDPHVEPIVRREAVTIYEDPSEPTKLPEANDCHDLTAAAASSSLDFWDNPLDDEWDRQIAADAAAGRLDHMIEEARADVAAGRCRPLEDVLADESDEAGR